MDYYSSFVLGLGDSLEFVQLWCDKGKKSKIRVLASLIEMDLNYGGKKEMLVTLL